MHLCMQFSELLENYGIFIHFFITISGSFRILGISVPFYESFVRNSINSDSISQNFLACGEIKFGRRSRKKVFDLSEFFACLKMVQVFDLRVGICNTIPNYTWIWKFRKKTGSRVFRLFSLTARCSKCDFWNPGQILS